MNITIIGVGAYSIGIAQMLAKNPNNKITMWTENKQILADFQTTHRVGTIFPNIEIGQNINMTTSYEKSLENTELIFLITSAKYVVSVCQAIKKYYHKNIPICIASKGIEHTTLNTLSNVVKAILNTNNICVISGPTFAIDLVSNEPAGLAIAGLNKKSINLVKKTLENNTLKLRISSDIMGIQLCGSIKNIIAIAAGILKGLGYSESTQAFLINESLHDMKQIIHALGGKKKTILSFAGVGDLLLTCSSSKSRNYSFGYVIGSTKNKEKIQEYLDNNTVEGYYTLNSIYQMLKNKNIDIPLITLIKDIVNYKKNPDELATFLINKD